MKLALDGVKGHLGKSGCNKNLSVDTGVLFCFVFWEGGVAEIEDKG